MVQNGETRPLPGKITMTVEQDTVIIHDQAGGGGFGDPLTRDAALVLEDIHDGKITPAYARERHGIVLGANGLVDEAASQSLRRTKADAARSGAGHGA
jgi:N-methylhydantoinase B